MRRIEFPLTGNLRPGDVLRTVYLDRDECAVRNMKSAEGRNLFEIAIDDYKPGCKQELWSIEGTGAFVHRDWKDGIQLPNLIVSANSQTEQLQYWLTSQDGLRAEELEDGRQSAIFSKILRSSHYMPMSYDDYQEWLEDYRAWNRTIRDRRING